MEGEVHASTVQIGDGAQVQGDIVADELTIGGRVKGTIRANCVKLNSTAVVEGDIYHRSLAIEENAQFEGMSRRQENAIDTPSRAPVNLPQAVSNDGNRKGNGASDFAKSLSQRSRIGRAFIASRRSTTAESGHSALAVFPKSATHTSQPCKLSGVVN